MCTVLAHIVKSSDLTVSVAQDYNALAADVANHIVPGCCELGDMADVLPVPVKNLLKFIGIDRFVIVIASWQGPGIVRIVAKVCEVWIRCRHDQSSGVRVAQSVRRCRSILPTVPLALRAWQAISHTNSQKNGLVIRDTPIVNGSDSESVTDDVVVREGVTGVIWDRGLIGT